MPFKIQKYQRAHILMLRKQGRSFNEIARQLNITKGTVAGVCFRAKTRKEVVGESVLHKSETR